LTDDIYSSANIELYLDALRECSQIRQLRAILHDTNNDLNNCEPIAEVIERHQQKVFEIGLNRKAEPKRISDFIGKLQSNAGGVSSGFIDLDRIVQFENGNMVVIAGRPGMGKTAFGLAVIANVAAKGIPCLILSMEMRSEDLLHRLAARCENISLEDIRFQRLDLDSSRKLNNGDYLNLPIYIEDSGHWTPAMIRSEIRRQIAQHQIQIVMIDYLGLISSDGHNSKYEEVTRISKEIKLIARSLGIPILILHQLNRATEGRTDKKPSLGDLRDSGAIEQDADVVLFPYREWIYDKAKTEGDADIIIAKNRQGRSGSVKVTWLGSRATFENRSQL
jgi:replicative DNA helicase